MRRRTFLAGAGALIAAPAVARAQGRIAVTLGVGGKPVLYYLPLSIAERKGFLSGEGLDVTINDFGGGAKALQALVGGSVDVVTGAYEHTIRMQAKGQDIRAVLELGRFPAIVLAVRKDLADKVKSAADLISSFRLARTPMVMPEKRPSSQVARISWPLACMRMVCS